MPDSTEILLIDRIRAGKPDAWSDLIARYEGRLLGYVARRVADRSVAEDIVQETFIGFLTSLPNYDAGQSLEGYLFSIAAHKLTDHMRREGRRPALAAGRRRQQRRLAASGSRPPRELHRPQPRAAWPGRIRTRGGGFMN